MGSGIATALLMSGIAVVIKEINSKFLDNAVAIINGTRWPWIFFDTLVFNLNFKGNLDRALEKGRLNKNQRTKVSTNVIINLKSQSYNAIGFVTAGFHGYGNSDLWAL